MVKLDILSDPVCPWCYIGKAYLDRALEQRPNHPFVIEWHPFQLNPEMPREGISRSAYVEAKFGGVEGVKRANAPVLEHAERAGIEMNLDAIQRSPNTLDAHRLIMWAGIEGRQTAIVSSLFRAYFVEGRDIGDQDTLADIADACGMDASVVLRLLATDEDTQTIRDKDTSAREMGVNSVPTFIVASQHAVPGAQPSELWLKVMDEIIEQRAEDA